MIRALVDRNCRAIYAWPLAYLAALLLLTGFLTYFYVTLPTETSVESLIIEDDADLVFYETFKDQFGEDEFLVVGFNAPDIFSAQSLAYIQKQTDRLKQLPEVDDVVSLSTVEDFVGSDYDFIVERLIRKMPTSAEEQEQLRLRAQDNTLVRDQLINSDSDATLLLIRPQEQENDPAFDERLVSKVEKMFSAAPAPFADFSWHIAGWLVTDVNLSRSMTRDMLIFMPLTFILLIILVSFALRNFWSVVVAMLSVSVSLIWTLAFLNLVGGAMSPITSILPPLIMALAVSDSIHVFNVFLKMDRREKPISELMRQTLCVLALPCFLTSFTTAIGFASLAVSQVPPIRHFGLAAAGGMLAEFCVTMTLIPLAIWFLRHKKGLQTDSMEKKSYLSGPLQRFADILPHYRTVLLWGSVALICLSLVAAMNIRVETNLLEYFKKDSSVRQASQFIDSRLGGVETLEVSLESSTEDYFIDPRGLQMVKRVENYLENQPIVSNVNSINDFFREMNKAFHSENPEWFRLPESRAMAAQYLLLYDGDDLDFLMNERRNWTRISARITEHNSSEVAAYIDALQNFLDEITQGTPVSARVTGKTLIANKLISFIVNSQVQSLALALALIFLVMLRIFRSFKLGLIALVPNVLPILLNFAVMGAFGVPLNSATAIIAAVAIGVAVDDTVHFIIRYQQQRVDGHNVEDAIKDAIQVKGSPIIMTSLIMTGGFGILLFGSFVPTIQFGVLSALIMIFAVISDLVVLPALLLKLDDA